VCSQYTPPTTATEYVHRVGRTARIGGRGSSLLFLTPAETAFIPELANHNIRSVVVLSEYSTVEITADGASPAFMLVHLLVLTVGAGLVVFQPIGAEVAGHPVQSDDG